MLKRPRNPYEIRIFGMSPKTNTPRQYTPVASGEKRQLADLAALLGLMQAASKLSQELDTLANEVGGSLEKMAERFGVPFFDIHNTYVQQISKGRQARPKKARKRS
jgi:transcriptional regulator GlxA family with amidase domain